MLDDDEARRFIDTGDAEGKPHGKGSVVGEKGSDKADSPTVLITTSLSTRLTTYQKMMVLNLVAVIWGSQHAVMKGRLPRKERERVPSRATVAPPSATMGWMARTPATRGTDRAHNHYTTAVHSSAQ